LHANGNLEFNSTKSKFVVVGKRTDKHKQWSLCNDKIGEDNNYKYFGASFSRILRLNYHITIYLKKNMEKTSMIRVLGKHGNFNRNCTMEFRFMPHYWTWVFHMGLQSRSLNYLNYSNVSCALKLISIFLLLNSLQYREYQQKLCEQKLNVPAGALLMGSYLGIDCIVFEVFLQ
jgi:hypothetical protein